MIKNIIFLSFYVLVFLPKISYAVQDLPKEEKEIYQRFLKGELIYKPNRENDDGKISLPISSLRDPLNGTFDLSSCGDASKYLSISTGYRKEKKSENENKIEIWITPRFLIKKELTTTAQHFQEILKEYEPEWPNTAPVGLFWTWGKWDELERYHYLTSVGLITLGADDLMEQFGWSRTSNAAEIKGKFRLAGRSAGGSWSSTESARQTVILEKSDRFRLHFFSDCFLDPAGRTERDIK